MRWQALCLIAEGGVANQAAEKSGRSGGWMSRTVRRYNEGGAGGVKNRSKNQASKTLTPEQVTELEILIRSGKTTEQRLWSGTQIKRRMAEKTGRETHKTTAWRMFGRLEFTRQSVRPQHKERATEEEQADFKKT